MCQNTYNFNPVSIFFGITIFHIHKSLYIFVNLHTLAEIFLYPTVTTLRRGKKGMWCKVV